MVRTVDALLPSSPGIHHRSASVHVTSTRCSSEQHDSHRHPWTQALKWLSGTHTVDAALTLLAGHTPPLWRHGLCASSVFEQRDNPTSPDGFPGSQPRNQSAVRTVDAPALLARRCTTPLFTRVKRAATAPAAHANSVFFRFNTIHRHPQDGIPQTNQTSSAVRALLIASFVHSLAGHATKINVTDGITTTTTVELGSRCKEPASAIRFRHCDGLRNLL
jgi:hypothetical protein